MKAADLVKLANMGLSQRICLYSVGGFTAETGMRIADITDVNAIDKETAVLLQRDAVGFDFQNDNLNIYVKIERSKK